MCQFATPAPPLRRSPRSASANPPRIPGDFYATAFSVTPVALAEMLLGQVGMSGWSATKYRPRDPRESVLFKVLETELPAFRAELDEQGNELPWFVIRELERFLHCGIAEHGAALARCRSCGHQRLVPWSCKGRGWCPACTTRRMHDTAMFLVDRVIPHVPVRMWVISFPPPLRYLLAYDATLCAQVMSIFLDEVYSWLRHSAMRELGLRDVREAHPGSVTFVQRFGKHTTNCEATHSHGLVDNHDHAAGSPVVRRNCSCSAWLWRDLRLGRA